VKDKGSVESLESQITCALCINKTCKRGGRRKMLEEEPLEDNDSTRSYTNS
jgi:hypothetical protein